MAHEIWLMRHGNAEPYGSCADSDRVLTERGCQQATNAGLALKSLGIKFDEVYMSPKVRARDTALLACKTLNVEPVVHKPLAHCLNARDVFGLLTHHTQSFRVLIVGHEPTLSTTIYELTGARVLMDETTVAAVQLDGTRGYLHSLLRPDQLKVIAQQPH